MGYRVLVTRQIPSEGMEILKGKCEKITLNTENRSWSKSELIKNLEGNDAVLCLLTDKIDKEVLIAAKQAEIKGFANMAVGYDNIDVDTATQLGIMITNTPGVLTETTAELAWALIFAVARRIVEADKFTRVGKFKGWEPLLFLGQDISHKTLGLIGAGRIGSAVAYMSRGFNMRILYYDVVRRPELETELNAKQTSLTELLSTADIISIHTPLTRETHHLIGAAEIKLMKPTAILINTSRGPVIDEAALALALKNRQIAGAGLDVYENEPQIHPHLLDLDNVVLLPHIGSASVGTRGKMARMAAENLLAILEGHRPPNLVNPQVLG